MMPWYVLTKMTLSTTTRLVKKSSNLIPLLMANRKQNPLDPLGFFQYGTVKITLQLGISEHINIRHTLFYRKATPLESYLWYHVLHHQFLKGYAQLYCPWIQKIISMDSLTSCVCMKW